MSPGPVRGGEHKEYLAAMGVPTIALEPIETYLRLVANWNSRTNLTAAQTAAERVRILVEDPYRASELLPGGKFVDVGSGNGSPGLILAVLRSDLRPVTLLEPRARRWAFLREAARLLGRGDIEVLRSRCEDFAGSAEVVTMRAVGLDPDVVGRIVAPGGHLFIFGGDPGETKSLTSLPGYELQTSNLHHFQRPHG